MWHKGSLGWHIGIIGRYRNRVTESIKKLIGSRFFAGYLILLIPLIHGSTPTSGPVFIADFEEGNISDMPGPQKNSPQGKIEVVTTPVRAGRYAVKMYAAPGDKRTELLLRGEQWATNRGYDVWFDESKGTEYYYTFSIYVPSDFPNVRNSAVLAQWHGQNGKSAPVALRYDGDTFSIASATQGPHHDLKTDIPAIKNGWNDFVFHVLWERDNKGLLEVWRRNSAGHFVKEVEKFNVNTIDDQNGVYFKWGVYSSGDEKGRNKPRTVYLDNLIIWGPDGRQNALDGVNDNTPPSAPRNLRVSTSS